MKLNLQRIIQFLLFGVLLVISLIYAGPILKPVALAIMLSMLMAPLCSWLDKKGLSRTFSVLICVLILLVSILIILGVVTAQIINFANDFPQIEKRSLELFDQAQRFVSEKFGVSERNQTEMLKKQISGLGDSLSTYATTILSGTTTTIATVILMLVFTFLMLFNKEKYELFFIKLYKEQDEGKIKSELAEISKVSQSYLSGRVISIVIQAVLFSIGLSIIGIKNAILLGCLAGLLTILPYVGAFIGGFFPVLMSLIHSPSMTSTIWVLVLFLCVQVLDNYFIEPKVVGGKVQLNAFFSILIIFIGGSIWGVVGMILFTPMLGIFKIICEHTVSLKPYAFLIGEEDK